MARNRKEVVQIGCKLPANLLMEQAEYTLALAQGDLAKLQRYGVRQYQPGYVGQYVTAGRAVPYNYSGL